MLSTALPAEVIAPGLPDASPERSKLARLDCAQIGREDIHVRACDAPRMRACRLDAQTFLSGDVADKFAVFGSGSHGVDLQMEMPATPRKGCRLSGFCMIVALTD
ncbi:hypothetical protein ACNKW1_02355 [Thauera sp. WH-2]|uniref:hypothetical protein n=1 Tax=Thauera sp. WH-2 TaxID=3401574 RepID=UPI003AB052E0